jgi:hypothetical protein
MIFIEYACGHTRRASPHTFAAFAGRDANLANVVKRLRCSKCKKTHRAHCRADETPQISRSAALVDHCRPTACHFAASRYRSIVWPAENVKLLAPGMS